MKLTNGRDSRVKLNKTVSLVSTKYSTSPSNIRMASWFRVDKEKLNKTTARREERIPQTAQRKLHVDAILTLSLYFMSQETFLRWYHPKRIILLFVVLSEKKYVKH